jgi:tRNA(adenine34) deaminase
MYFMRLALEEAGLAFSEGEVPVGAVLVTVDGALLSRAHNKKETLQDPTAHAEIAAMRDGAGIVHNWRLSGTTLYVTKEPCIMCAGTMIHARIGRLVYGCNDSKGGAVNSLFRLLTDKRLNHQVDVVSGVLEKECASILKRFFADRRSC